MSIKSIVYIDGVSKEIYANKYYFENSYKYTFYCPSCKCKMNIQSRRLSNNKNTYFFFSNSHDKKNCTLYRENHGKSIIHEGTPTISFGIFSDNSNKKTKISLSNKETTLNDKFLFQENNNTTTEFKKQNPRLNNIHDCINWIENSSINENKINVGNKNNPNYKTINEILFRKDNFENYHSKKLDGIGILWGGARFDPKTLGLSFSKDLIAVKEYLPKSKLHTKIKPIIFLLDFSSIETKRNFSNKYYNFNNNLTDLIIIGNWEKQPSQNGYQIYKSKIGKKCYTFIDHEKNKEETTEMISLKED